MALRAVKPKKIEKRLKMYVYGKAGIGKTTAALQFPNSYIIDTEKGTDFYSDVINKSNSVVFKSLNPDEIKEELKELLTTNHDYKTLIIDPMTQVYHAVQGKWNRIFEKHSKNAKDKEVMDFGMRYWGKVKSDFKSIQRIILALDMNVIITSHQKDVYGAGFSKVGVTFDDMKDSDYIFDLVFRIEKRGDERIAITEKERAEIGKQKFPEEFIWSYENFLKFYGKEIIERKSVILKMATKAQVKKINALIDTVKVDDAVILKWFTKADVDAWEQMTQEQIIKAITFLEKKLDSLKEPEKEGK